MVAHGDQVCINLFITGTIEESWDPLSTHHTKKHTLHKQSANQPIFAPEELSSGGGVHQKGAPAPCPVFFSQNQGSETYMSSLNLQTNFIEVWALDGCLAGPVLTRNWFL